MCDTPQTMEALTVRRSRDVGGVGFHFTSRRRLQERFSKKYGSLSQGEGMWKDKGQKNRQGHPGSLELES